MHALFWPPSELELCPPVQTHSNISSASAESKEQRRIRYVQEQVAKQLCIPLHGDSMEGSNIWSTGAMPLQLVASLYVAAYLICGIWIGIVSQQLLSGLIMSLSSCLMQRRQGVLILEVDFSFVRAQACH